MGNARRALPWYTATSATSSEGSTTMWIVSDSHNLVYPQFICPLRPVTEHEWLRAQAIARKQLEGIPPSRLGQMSVHHWWQEMLTQPMAPDKLMVMNEDLTLGRAFLELKSKGSFIRIIEEVNQ